MATKEITINNSPNNTIVQTIAPANKGDNPVTIIETAPKKDPSPSMISIGPLKVSHPDMGIAIMGVIVIVVGGIIIRKWLRKAKKKKNKTTKKK